MPKKPARKRRLRFLVDGYVYRVLVGPDTTADDIMRAIAREQDKREAGRSISADDQELFLAVDIDLDSHMPPDPAYEALVKQCKREVTRRARKDDQDRALLDELDRWQKSDRAFALHKATQEHKRNPDRKDIDPPPNLIWKWQKKVSRARARMKVGGVSRSS